jgi:hypothetical protein
MVLIPDDTIIAYITVPAGTAAYQRSMKHTYPIIVGIAQQRQNMEQTVLFGELSIWAL